MNIKRHLNTTILLLLMVFAVLSITGAFLGARRAQAFFNSLPMIIFWCVLLLLLMAGFFVYVSLRRRFGLALIHAGCILVLAGGMYGSRPGHLLSDRLSDKQSFTKGSLSLYQGQLSNYVTTEAAGEIRYLPFSIRLKEAFVEYYDKPLIRLHFRDGSHFDTPLESGEIIEVPNHRGTVEIVRVYKNFKIKRQGDTTIPYDSTAPGYNPACELIFTREDGTARSFFVFERFPMPEMSSQMYRAEYVAPRMVKDYKSVLQVMEEGKLIEETTIEVNKPLYYGGYHFYQHTFGYDQSGPISGILVSSARGVWIVFAGYAMIFIGLVLQLWRKRLRKQKCPETCNRVMADDSEGQTQ